MTSGQTSFNQVVTQGWKAENAQKRMDTLLSANYTSTTLDGVLSPNDTLARAIITSVKQRPASRSRSSRVRTPRSSR